MRLKELLLALRRAFVTARKVGDGLVDVFRPTGWVEFRLIHATGPKKGQVARVIRGRNVVTSWLSAGGASPTSGRDLMRRRMVPQAFTGSLSGDDDTAIHYIQLGDDGTVEQASDTGLGSALAGTEKAVSAVEYDATNSYVTFVFEYDETEANTTIRELVVLSGRGATGSRDVFARKTVGAFDKDEDFGLQVRYTLRF